MLLLAATSPAQQDDLTGLAGWAADVIAALGAPGVAFLTAIENLFPPIPSEVVLPLAGYLAARGQLSLVWAVIAATLGSLAGAIALYEIAAAVGTDRLRRLLGAIPLMDGEDLDRAEGWFDRHGRAAVFLGRFVPGVRSLVSIPAGAEDMPRVQFWLLTLAGSAVWNTTWIVAGWSLGSAWRSLGRYSDWINWALIAALVVIVARFVWSRRHRISGAVTSS